ncbi:methylated-DNA--[protein]-cysteine S-methyltransferase [Anaerocolumna aminovalerica]|uniref:methylated-DNA--[protein]-cysteine S-methyltransferase n=1 Tax=Anaerocolumna aminovalerica TaxID=1527 RepID=UPI002ED53F13
MYKRCSFPAKSLAGINALPYGKTMTYRQVAEAIGNPKAYRAVGMANNRNQIPIIIPCHRVIGSNGKLVGYAGGLHINEKLLEMEENKYANA